MDMHVSHSFAMHLRRICHTFVTYVLITIGSGLLSMVSAGAIPDLIADLPDHTPPGLENLMSVPEGFGHTPASPSTPSACQLQQLPCTPEVQHRPKASSPLVPRRQLFTVIHSDKVNTKKFQSRPFAVEFVHRLHRDFNLATTCSRVGDTLHCQMFGAYPLVFCAEDGLDEVTLLSVSFLIHIHVIPHSFTFT